MKHGLNTEKALTGIPRVAVVLACAFLLGCEPKQGEKMRGLTHVPASAKVELGPRSKHWMVELPEPLRRRFIEMIHSEATYVDFRAATALPWGVFLVEGETFYWHGNAVVHPESRRGRSWKSPLMQALINTSMSEPPTQQPNLSTAEAWKAVLEELAKSTNLDSTPVEGHGRYPRKTTR